MSYKERGQPKELRARQAGGEVHQPASQAGGCHWRGRAWDVCCRTAPGSPGRGSCGIGRARGRSVMPFPAGLSCGPR